MWKVEVVVDGLGELCGGGFVLYEIFPERVLTKDRFMETQFFPA